MAAAAFRSRSADWPETAGVVHGVEAVSYRHERRAQGAPWTAVPGSATFETLASVPGLWSEAVAGYLVDLDTVPSGPTG